MRPLRSDFKALFFLFFPLLFFVGGIFLSEFEPGPRSALAELSSDSPPFAASFVSTRPKMVFIDPPGIFYAPDSPYDLYRIDRSCYYHYVGGGGRGGRRGGAGRGRAPARGPGRLK